MDREIRNCRIVKLFWIVVLIFTVSGCSLKSESPDIIDADKNYKIRQDSIKAKYDSKNEVR